MIDNTERLGELFQVLSKYLWVREESVGSWDDRGLARQLGGHVRFQLYRTEGHTRIARWSGTPRNGYRPMKFNEFLAMQSTGRFPLRRLVPRRRQ